jgi:probable rRNA maturation factor
MRVETSSSLRGRSYPAVRARAFLNRALRLSGRSAREVSLRFCADGAMRRLNARYRGKDKTTDVLSFPSGRGDGFLGDIVISVPEARRLARRERIAFEAVVRRLLLHGLLHLLGYDHETDTGQMDRFEGRLRRRLEIPS